MVAGSIRIRQTIGDDPILQQMLKQREIHAKNQIHDYSHIFRKKSSLELIRLCSIMVGIEFAYAAETAFVSPILLKIGIEHKHMTMVWGLSPIFGFFLSPLMGSLSDRCHLKWGRRRPVILLLSIGMFIGLIFVPWGRDFGLLSGDKLWSSENLILNSSSDQTHNYNLTNPSIYDNENVNNSNHRLNMYKWAVLYTIVGAVFLDFSADTLQTPSRTYLLDVTISDDHAKGLSIFTIMAGIGGFFGYSMSAIDWDGTDIGYLLGEAVKTVFTIVIIIFIICAIVTFTSYREVPLSLLATDELLHPISQEDIKKELKRHKNLNPIIIEKVNRRSSEINPTVFCVNANRTDVDIEKIPHTRNNETDIDGNTAADEQLISLGQYLKSILIMPTSIKILCITNLFSWMADISYSLYFTDFVGEAVFKGDPSAPQGSESYVLYDTGVRFGCWGLAICALSCSAYSMYIERLIRLFGAKTIYISGLLTFGIGMLILAVFPTKLGVLILSVSAGILFSTIYTIPYIIIANYHSKESFKIKCGASVPVKQTRGLGTDVAIISNMMFVAQTIISVSIGQLITLTNTTTTVIYSASLFSILSALMATQVLYLDL